MHDVVTGRSASGILEFINQMPIDWFSKQQGQVKTATYGSEFVAAQPATERMIDLCYVLHSFGDSLNGPLWMFGNNKSVIASGTIPHSIIACVRLLLVAGCILSIFREQKIQPIF